MYFLRLSAEAPSLGKDQKPQLCVDLSIHFGVSLWWHVACDPISGGDVEFLPRL